MNARPSPIDLGLLAMPVGEGQQPQARPECIDMRVQDIQRLQTLLGALPDAAGEHQAASQQENKPAPIRPREEAAGNEFSRLALAIGQLWTGNGSRSQREVRVRLAPDLLPGTWVRMFEHGGRLHVEFTCSDEDARLWLHGSLGRLALALGARLDRPLHLALVGAAGEQLVGVNWPEENQA